jgi:hypothetical protein
MANVLQAERRRDFRRRVEYAPRSVYQHRTHGWEYIGWVYLQAVFDLPFVTRQAFEEAMTRFFALGFPDGQLFDLQPDQGSVWLAEIQFTEDVT